MQFQQAARSEGGARTEAPASVANCREREDGKVAVHAPVRGAYRRDQTTAHRGRPSSFLFRLICLANYDEYNHDRAEHPVQFQ